MPDGDLVQRRLHFGDLLKSGQYTPLHNDLFDPACWTRWLDPAFRDAAESPDSSADVWRKVANEEAPGVFSFPLFTAEFCELLLQELDAASSGPAASELSRPNGMNRYGVVLNQLGLEPAITALQQRWIQPCMKAFFPEEGGEPSDHHCFIVKYAADRDVGLDMHEDGGCSPASLA